MKNKQNYVKKLEKHKLAIVFLFFATTIILIATFFIFVQTHQFFAANFADDFLRPRIGTQATLIIEAFFFKLQDTENRITYRFKQPSQEKFIVKKATSTDTQFLLKQIAPITNLPYVAGEGTWTPITISSKSAIMAETFLRPDQERPYAIVSLVKMDMSKLSLGIVAGTYEPGEQAKRGPGFVPNDVQKSNMLEATFNGGFKRTDGGYGMIVGNNVYVPLQENLATLVIYQNAKPKIVEYTGQDLGKNILAIRQNGPMLVQNAIDVSKSAAWNMQTWGLTTTNSMYTWRSGIGVTKNGNLIYAVGPSLVPETLAKTLLAAGAVNAMQLDINPVWVRFVLFNSIGDGLYTYKSLQDSMVNGGYAYLHGYQKDFFYVFRNGK